MQKHVFMQSSHHYFVIWAKKKYSRHVLVKFFLVKHHANQFKSSQVSDAYGRTDRMNLLGAQHGYERHYKSIPE